MKLMYSICVLFVTVIISYDVTVAQTDSHGPLITKSINTTANIGESILFDCAEHIEFLNSYIVTFNWSFNGKSIPPDDKRILMENKQILSITNVINHDSGIYLCVSSNEPVFQYSKFLLTVVDLSNRSINNTISTITHISYDGGSLYWNCKTFDGESSHIDTYTWLKDEKPLHLAVNNTRISLENNNISLKITNIKEEDKGKYKCIASNKFQNDITVFMLIYDYRSNASYIQTTTQHHVNENVSWNCSVIDNHLGANYNNYAWFKNDTPIHKNDSRMSLIMNNSTLKINNLNPQDTGIYRCNASNTVGSYTQNLSVVDSPVGKVYEWYFSNLTLVVNSTIQFQCRTLYSSKKKKTSFKWMKNDKPLVLTEVDDTIRLTNDNETLVIHVTELERKVTYKCEAATTYYRFYSAYTYNVVESQSPKFYNESNSSISIKTGDSVELWCYAYGMPPPSIKWKKNGFPFSPYNLSENDKARVLFEESQQKLEIKSTKLGDSGTYECHVENRIKLCVAQYNLHFNDSNSNNQNGGLLHSKFTYVVYCIVLMLILAVWIIVDFRKKRKRRFALKERLLVSSMAPAIEINNLDLK